MFLVHQTSAQPSKASVLRQYMPINIQPPYIPCPYFTSPLGLTSSWKVMKVWGSPMV